MARSNEDIINVSFDLKAELSLDIERIVEDPIWKTVCFSHGLNDNNYYPELLIEYIQYYVTRERFLSLCPSTNGPGTLTGDYNASS